MKRLAATLSVLASAACSNTTSLPPTPPLAASAEPVVAQASGIGAACTTERPFQQGDCSAGQLCAPAPGGYCLSEYDALLIDEARGVLHAVWTQPIDEDGVPTSRVFHASASLRDSER